MLFEADNGGYELGFDYGQPYKRQKYSLGVICIRSLDLPGERRSEKRFRKTVAIFPGPNEPRWLWPYFQGILTEFLVGWKNGELYEGRCFGVSFKRPSDIQRCFEVKAFFLSFIFHLFGLD